MLRRFVIIVGALLTLASAANAANVAARRALLVNQAPSWVLRGGTTGGEVAALDYDFARGLYYQSNNPCRNPSSCFTVSRASTAYEDDLAGNWINFPSNTFRVTNKGALIEEVRTNSIRNNSMQGASAGSPGTLPTNWTSSVSPTDGLSQQIVGVGVENGINYVDIRWSGTANSGTQFLLAQFDSITAVYGQVWSASVFATLVGGSVANTLFLLDNHETGGLQHFVAFVPVAGNLGQNRIVKPIQFIQPATTAAQPRLLVTPTNGAAVDFTLRIGWPQEELNSLIDSAVSTATVSNGGSTGVYAVNDVLTIVGGTGTAATLIVTGASVGKVTTASVTTAGDYTVLPPSPASVTGGGGTGATFTLAPKTALAGAAGFTTSPIRTTNATASRAADVVSVAKSPSLGVSAMTLFAKATPLASGYPSSQIMMQVDDGGANNLVGINRSAQGSAFVNLVVAGVNTASGNSSFPQNTQKRMAASFTSGTQHLSVAGTMGSAGTGGYPARLSAIRIGSDSSGNASANAYLSRFALWPPVVQPDVFLQFITGPNGP